MTNTENISQNRKAARWAMHETAMDIRHDAQGIIDATSTAPSWEDSLSAARTVTELAQRMTEQAVSVARADGATWAEIGDMLGVTRQAAQQRYADNR